MRRTKRKSGFIRGGLLTISLIILMSILSHMPFAENIQSNSTAKSKQDLLVLVNKANKIPDNYNANLIVYEDSEMSELLLEDLKKMRDTAEKQGINIYIDDAYRSKQEQEKVFNNTINKYIKQGSTQNAAKEKAKQIAALPGYSEHETGLAIDFSLRSNPQDQEQMWQWLKGNAYKYGFILRYPEGKEHITGYSNEPWHYRYVGKKHAKTMYEKGIVLEEYLN